ncbi:LppA family lipoprotein [Nocardia lasii]|uniref:LppA family lipoprotein n=1 Tax=Nocardia lasii TaxID=1616107 RepID=A0ABW1JM35_9NOCA
MTKSKWTANKKNSVVVIVAVPVVLLFVVLFIYGPWIWATWFDTGTNPPTSADETAEAAETLQQRVTAEDRSAQVARISQSVQEAVIAVSPSISWSVKNISDGTRPCAKPFDQTHGTLDRLTYSISGSQIPDASWGELRDRIASVLEPAAMKVEYKEAAVDRPSPTITATDPVDGSSVSIFNSGATSYRPAGAIISATIGCHLPANKYSSPIR